MTSQTVPLMWPNSLTRRVKEYFNDVDGLYEALDEGGSKVLRILKEQAPNCMDLNDVIEALQVGGSAPGRLLIRARAKRTRYHLRLECEKWYIEVSSSQG